MTGTMTLLDVLQERGFTPDESGADWFDLPTASGHMVRAELDDTDVNVHVLTGNGCCCWSVRLSGGTPATVVAAVIDLAITHAYTEN
jgi:hypothetical protein